MTEKTCCTCRGAKPVQAFTRHRGRKDGLQPKCKACVAEHRKSPGAQAYSRAWSPRHSVGRPKCFIGLFSLARWGSQPRALIAAVVTDHFWGITRTTANPLMSNGCALAAMSATIAVALSSREQNKMAETLRKSHINVHKRQPCPRCGHELDSMTAVSHDEPPEPGSICVCIGCGTPLEYDGRGLVECDVTKLPIATAQTIRKCQQAIQKLGNADA